MIIKQLSESTINKIAAGEVVERPASVVKELVENAIDAGSLNIDIVIRNGGQNLIAITDDGVGMSRNDLELSVLRHTTSKLDEKDINDIKHFGFRGEALPSIAAVARVDITSKDSHSDEHAWKIIVNGGEVSHLEPSSLAKGTNIEVRDLFFITPARLKFLRSEKAETNHIIDIVRKLALAHPNINFCLSNEKKTLLNTDQPTLNQDLLSQRVAALMGQEFIDNSQSLNISKEGKKIIGFVSLPTLNRGTSSELYLFVNNRPVRDKLIIAAVKVAYQDFLASNRYPIVVIFLTIDTTEVDVNVHPNKLEVRFKDQAEIRALCISAIKHAINEAKFKNSSTNGVAMLNNFTSEITTNNITPVKSTKIYRPKTTSMLSENAIIHKYSCSSAPIKQQTTLDRQQPDIQNNVVKNDTDYIDLPLGQAKCQLYETYIVASNANEVIIVDQHAAHERIVYEKLKSYYFGQSAKTQRLLIPEIVDLEKKAYDKLIAKTEELSNFGLIIESFGVNSIKVSEAPALINKNNIKKLILDLVDDLLEYGENLSFNEMLEHILGTFACHHSIRSGRRLNIDEMNAMLRKIESTNHSGQCNHGRPTYIKLKIEDIEKLFGRK